MKTVIFFGSARRNGRSADILNHVLSRLQGEVQVIHGYDTAVSPCRDCRYCLSHTTCAIKDGMQDIYAMLESADNVLFLTPLYFHFMPAPLKTVIDRMQPYWASYVRGDRDTISSKRGAMVIIGGAPHFEKQFDPCVTMLEAMLGDLNASKDAVICMDNADAVPFSRRKDIRAAVDALIDKWNGPL